MSSSSVSGAGAAPADARTIVLFDVDGTLTPSRRPAGAELRPFLAALRARVRVGLVGGSDLSKQKEQLGEDVLSQFDYVFAENGLDAYKAGARLAQTSFVQHIGEPAMQSVINFCLRYIADLDIPVKRGTFVEFRSGALREGARARGGRAVRGAARRRVPSAASQG